MGAAAVQLMKMLDSANLSLFGSVEVHVAAVAAFACAVGGAAAAGAAAGAEPPEQAVDGAQRQRQMHFVPNESLA